MEIVRLNSSYIDELIELWSQSFILPYEQVSTWVNEKNIRNCIGAIENGKLVSALSINALEGYIRNEIFSFSGIGGVATFPEKRGKKHVHCLLKEAIRISKDEKKIFSSLYPFSFEFYRNFGWELGGFKKRYKIKTSLIPRYQEIEKVKRIPLSEWKIIKPIYETYAKGFSGAIKRSDEQWESIIFRTKNLTYLYIYEDQKIEGYLLYNVEKTNINKIIVREMICLNNSAYKGFLSLFSRQAMNIEEIEITTPLNDILPFILPNPSVECNIEPTFMIRIVDVEKALSKIKYNVKDKISIKVKDEYAEWNNGVWEIEINDEVKVLKKEDSDYDLSLSINTLSQIISGILSPKTAYELGLIEIKNIPILEKMENLFPEHPTFCWDYF
uniref:GNAT family N-acetyltransferase n=1 Tax=Dictyoglomus thermophilum TaxID=14 RepID=A0A7C3RKV5_DICTH